MTPGGSTIEIEDKVRKSLHPLQPTATDKENLVGAGRILRSTIAKTSIKNDMNNKTKTDSNKTINKSKVIVKNDINKKIKSDLKNSKDTKKTELGKILAKDLTSEAEPSLHYWKLLAETRGNTLQNFQEENVTLKEKIITLKEEIDTLKEEALTLKEENESLKEENGILREERTETLALVEELKEIIYGNDS